MAEQQQRRSYLHFSQKERWRSWLERHHLTEKEIWLVFYKKHTGRTNLEYDEAVEEAICYGWIDSIISKLDSDRFARKFTPRLHGSHWSELNVWRAQRMFREGRMTGSGLAVAGPWINISPAPQRPKPQPVDIALPQDLAEKLQKHPPAWQNFNCLAPSHRRTYLGWVLSAKRKETRLRREEELIALLKSNQKLGMK